MSNVDSLCGSEDVQAIQNALRPAHNCIAEQRVGISNTRTDSTRHDIQGLYRVIAGFRPNFSPRRDKSLILLRAA